MASTYSPSLKITLPGDGDQAGLWGQTTNTNLGTLVEQAITGVVSITMSDANYTLTSFNGITDEARNAVLVVTGTNAAIRDLIPPVVEKLYTIANNTTGGFAIRVIGASGTGVNIPNGATCLVYCDGTNFINGLSGTSGNFSINGTLSTTGALTYGGVTLSNSVTGTGSMALSASPTFTGTPAAPTASPGTNTTQIATTAFVTAALIAVYPVGSIYINATSSSNPNTLLGFGTWAAFGAGRVMVGLDAGDPLFDTAEETGGSKDAVVVSHTHTATSTVTDPQHTHTTAAVFFGSGGIASSVGGSNLVENATITSASTGITVATTNSTEGSSGTNANVQPYITVRMWKRTA
jgi:hypothetical protein